MYIFANFSVATKRHPSVVVKPVSFNLLPLKSILVYLSGPVGQLSPFLKVSVQVGVPNFVRGLSGGGVNPGYGVEVGVMVGGTSVAVAVGIGNGSVAVGSLAGTSVVATPVVIEDVSAGGGSVASGGNSPVARALVGEGISVSILATRVAISESLTGGGVGVVKGNVQALKSTKRLNMLTITNQFFERMRFSP